MLEQRFTESRTEQLRVMDMSGKLVLDLGTQSGRSISLPVDLRGYKPGIYMLEITSAAEKRVLKLPVK